MSTRVGGGGIYFLCVSFFFNMSDQGYVWGGGIRICHLCFISLFSQAIKVSIGNF
jgi:hypothetical protein